MDKKVKLGPTGEFPQGKMNQSDEGAIVLAVTAKDGKVLISFGKPIAWLGMDSVAAEGLANLIKKNARRARRQMT